jgi:hypothetical protein
MLSKQKTGPGPRLPSSAQDQAWEDSDSVVHWVPFTIGDRYTLCDLRIAWRPGLWSDREINCVACIARRGNFAGKLNERPAPLLRREAGMFVFRWPFRTTGGMFHGVVVPLKYSPERHDVDTLCGTSVSMKLSKQTGRWTHGREPLNCIGCLAVASWRPE